MFFKVTRNKVFFAITLTNLKYDWKLFLRKRTYHTFKMFIKSLKNYLKRWLKDYHLEIG